MRAHRSAVHLREENFADIDIRVRVQGGGHTSQVYAIRQAIAKAVNHILREVR